ncbi:hypothetical protein V1264_016566 [Littorina saxatilis]|uniref:Uncharacterized protein n=3 Tax=Littorina saxatilis TaxID=31220 RepID=A0AAN9BG48_9CAEN
MTSSYIEDLLLMGVLSDGDKFHTTVKLHPEDCAKTSTSVPSGFPNTNSSGLAPTPVTVASDLTSSLDVTTFGDGENYTSFALAPARVLPDQRLVVMLGSIGCGLLFLVGLSIVFNAVMRKRRVGGRSGKLPPPPAPHSVRRAAGDSVMICDQPPPLPDRPTFVSAHVSDYADYAEIPCETDPSLSNKVLTTLDSSPVSDSSMSDDCLHHIACPSSDSSMSEDYLHPVASASKSVEPATAT